MTENSSTYTLIGDVSQFKAAMGEAAAAATAAESTMGRSFVGMVQQMAAANASAAGLNAQFAKLAKLRGPITNFNQFRKVMEGARLEAGMTVKELRVVWAGFKQAGKGAAGISKQFGELASRLGGVSTGLQQTTADLKDTASESVNTRNNFGLLQYAIRRVAGALVVMAAIRAVRGLIRIGEEASKSAGELEYLATRVQALTINSEQSLGDLEEAFNRVAVNTGTAAEEVGKGMYYISSGGVKGAESMKLLGLASKMAYMGMGDIGDIARITASAIYAYRDSGMDATRATNVLFETVRQGNVDVAELVHSMGRLLLVASASDVPFKEVGAALAVMTKYGAPADQAVTGIRRLLIALSRTPTKKVIDTYQSMGVSYEEMRHILLDQGLNAAMEKMYELTGDNVVAVESLIPNIRALVPALIAMKEEASDTGNTLDAFADTSLSKVNQGMEEFEKGSKFATAQLAAEWHQAITDIGKDLNYYVDIVKHALAVTLEAWHKHLQKVREEQAKEKEFMDKATAELGYNPETGATVNVPDTPPIIKSLSGHTLTWMGDRVRDVSVSLKELGKAEESTSKKVKDNFDSLGTLLKELEPKVEKVKRAFMRSTDFESTLASQKDNIKELATAYSKASKDTISLEEATAKYVGIAKEAFAIGEKRRALKKLMSIIDANHKRDVREESDLVKKAADLEDKWTQSLKITSFEMQKHAKLINMVMPRSFVDTLIDVADASNRLDESVTSQTSSLELAAKASDDFTEFLHDNSDAIYDLAAAIAEQRGIEPTFDAMSKIINEIIGNLRDARAATDEWRESVKSFGTQFKEAFADVQKKSSRLFDGFDSGSLVDAWHQFGEDASTAFFSALFDFNGPGIQNTLAGLMDQVSDWINTKIFGVQYQWDTVKGDYRRDAHGNKIPVAGSTDTARRVAAGIQGAMGVYSMYQQMQQGQLDPISGLMQGAAAGAAIGSSIPGGAVIGTAIGAAVGLIASMFSHKKTYSYGASFTDTGAVEVTPDETRHISEAEQLSMSAAVTQATRSTYSTFLDMLQAFNSIDVFAEAANASLAENMQHFYIEGQDYGDVLQTFIQHDVPRRVQNALHGALVMAFRGLNIDANSDFFKELFSQADDLIGDAYTEFIMNVAKGAVDIAKAIKDMDFGTVLYDATKGSFETLSDSMTDTFNSISVLQARMSAELTLDAKAKDVSAIAKLVQDARSSEIQMLQQIDSIQKSITSSIKGAKETLGLRGLSDSSKGYYFAEMVIDQFEKIGDALNPEQVQDASNAVIGYMQNLTDTFSDSQLGEQASAAFQDVFGTAGTGMLESLEQTFGVSAQGKTLKQFFQDLYDSLNATSNDALAGFRGQIEDWSQTLQEQAAATAIAFTSLTDTTDVLSQAIQDLIDQINNGGTPVQHDTEDTGPTPGDNGAGNVVHFHPQGYTATRLNANPPVSDASSFDPNVLLASFRSVFEAMSEPIDDFSRNSMATFLQTMADSKIQLGDISDAMREALTSEDMITQLNALHDLTENVRQTELEMLKNIQETQSQINEDIFSSIENLALGGMNDLEKAIYWSRRLGESFDALRNATSPEEIRSAVDSAMKDIQGLVGAIGEQNLDQNAGQVFSNLYRGDEWLQRIFDATGLSPEQGETARQFLIRVYQNLEDTSQGISDRFSDVVNSWGDSLNSATADVIVSFGDLFTSSSDLADAWNAMLEEFGYGAARDAGDSDRAGGSKSASADGADIFGVMSSMVTSMAEMRRYDAQAVSSVRQGRLFDATVSNAANNLINLDVTIEGSAAPLIRLVDARITRKALTSRVANS